MQFSDVAILVRINSLGSLKGPRYCVRLGLHDQIYILPHHRVSTTRAWEIRGWCRQRLLGYHEPERTLRTSRIRTRLPVEENDHEPKIYQKNGRGEQDAIRPETYEKSTRIQNTGRCTDEEGVGTERSGDLHG